MLDIKFVRENPDVVKENIRKKFQDQKIPMVDDSSYFCVFLVAKCSDLAK